MRRVRDLRVRWPIHQFPDGACIQLPAIATIPQAPLRSRTVGFPQSGSDLGFPLRAFPRPRRNSSADTHTPRLRWSTHKLVPASTVTSPRLCVRESPWDRQVPRAPLLHTGVTVMEEASCASSKGVTPSSSLIRTHAPERCAPAASGCCLVRLVFAGCCQPLLPSGPSRRCLCRCFPTRLDPYSGCSQGARARYYPQDIGLPLVRTRSAHRFAPAMATSAGVNFQSCSHSLRVERPTA